jgi:hypothetical protein
LFVKSFFLTNNLNYKILKTIFTLISNKKNIKVEVDVIFSIFIN